MKKILGALLIGIFALAVSSYALTPGKISLGADIAAGNLGLANCTALTLGYNFTDSIAACLGLNYNSYTPTGGSATSQTGIAARVSYTLPVMWGAASPVVGLQYSTDGASTATSIISLLLGVQAEIANGVGLNVGLIPYSTATVSGASNSDSALSTGTTMTVMRGAYIGYTVDLN